MGARRAQIKSRAATQNYNKMCAQIQKMCVCVYAIANHSFNTFPRLPLHPSLWLVDNIHLPLRKLQQQQPQSLSNAAARHFAVSVPHITHTNAHTHTHKSICISLRPGHNHMSRSCKQLQFLVALMTHNLIVLCRNGITNIYLNISNSKDGRLLDKLVQFALKQFGGDHCAGRPQWVTHHILHPDFGV